jgi:hypothetical protein
VYVAERFEGCPDAFLSRQGVVHPVASDVQHLGTYLLLDLNAFDRGPG